MENFDVWQTTCRCVTTVLIAGGASAQNQWQDCELTSIEQMIPAQPSFLFRKLRLWMKWTVRQL